MTDIRVVSFDMEGTLAETTFSNLIWENDIPRLYAEKHGIGLEAARRHVLEEYRRVGDERIEWYDVSYWFEKLRLQGDWRTLLQKRRSTCSTFPEARGVLERLKRSHELVVISNTIREFLEVQICDLAAFFTRIFSAPSDFGEVKKSAAFYGRICRELDVAPRSVAHVGDHLKFDYEVPRQIGIRAYFLDRSGKAEGDHIVHDLEEFERKVLGT